MNKHRLKIDELFIDFISVLSLTRPFTLTQVTKSAHFAPINSLVSLSLSLAADRLNFSPIKTASKS